MSKQIQEGIIKTATLNYLKRPT